MKQKTQTIEIKIHPRYFNKPFRSLLNNETRMVLLPGGASSGKSYSIMRMAILWALQGRSILVARKVGATITNSVWSEIVFGIHDMGLTHLFMINKTSRLIESVNSEGTILFTGLDDKEKLKSIRSPKSHSIDTVIAEEMTEFTKDDIDQLLIRQRGGRCKYKKQFIGLFNPISEKHWIKRVYFDPIDWNGKYYEDDRLKIIHSTYLDNHHLSDEDIDTIQMMKVHNPLYYQVYGLGEWGILGDRVFQYVNYEDIDFEAIKDLPWRLGIDYGGLKDYNTLSISKIDKKNRTIYLIDGIEHIGLDFNPFAEQIIALLESYDIPLSSLILTDTSDRRADEILRQWRLSIKHARKGPGSELMQIKWLNSYKLVANKNKPMFSSAFNDYVWEEDKNGDIKGTNHCPDILAAFRYSFTNDMKGSKTGFGRMK